MTWISTSGKARIPEDGGWKCLDTNIIGFHVPMMITWKPLTVIFLKD